MRFVKRLKGPISAGTPRFSLASCHFTGASVLSRYHSSPPIVITPFRVWARDNDGVADGHGIMHSRFRDFIQLLNSDLGLSLSLPPSAQVPECHVPGWGDESEIVGATH